MRVISHIWFIIGVVSLLLGIHIFVDQAELRNIRSVMIQIGNENLTMKAEIKDLYQEIQMERQLRNELAVDVYACKVAMNMEGYRIALVPLLGPRVLTSKFSIRATPAKMDWHRSGNGKNLAIRLKGLKMLFLLSKALVVVGVSCSTAS